MKNTNLFFIIIILSGLIFSCKYNLFRFGIKYTGNIDFTKYECLKDKKIFLDPGHGGKGDKDRFRAGPSGITEEEANLRVALILKDMLKKSGAVVSLSRERDNDMPLSVRTDMIKKFMPDLLISLHHNGSARRVDNVNYPAVLIWGNREVRPLSYIFAEILIDEFHRIMDEKGGIMSDFAIYKETGTAVLRETRYICPGVIGEPGFFSDPDHAIRLKDIQYNTEEAEAYFYAIARFFERGIPTAEVLVSSPINNETYLYNLLQDDNPIIAVRTDSGADNLGIIKNSLVITMDGITVKCRAQSDDLFFIDYGKKLYPGSHILRFSFKNKRAQSSMIYSSGFTVDIRKGDYDRLADQGIKLINNKIKRKEGLKMLLSALSMDPLGSKADKIIWNIARGFTLIGDKFNSDYYYAKLYNFYPQSKYTKKLKSRFGYRFPIEYNGKHIDIKYEPSLKNEVKNNNH